MNRAERDHENQRRYEEMLRRNFFQKGEQLIDSALFLVGEAARKARLRKQAIDVVYTVLPEEEPPMQEGTAMTVDLPPELLAQLEAQAGVRPRPPVP